MNTAAHRSGSLAAGAAGGLAGLAVFLVLHHAWIAPIWFIAPVGAILAAGGGAAVGAAYGELLPRLPARPWTALSIVALVAAILAPSIVLAELRGPMYRFGPDGESTLNVPFSEALTTFVVGLLGTAALTGAALGSLIGRTGKAGATTALAGLALAIGPGHNIPFVGGTPATTKELTILGLVVGVAALVLVEVQASLRGRPGFKGGSPP
jgi:hypothetical protein